MTMKKTILSFHHQLGIVLVHVCSLVRYLRKWFLKRTSNMTTAFWFILKTPIPRPRSG